MKTAIVVDPYSTGTLLAPRLRARGYRTVAVQSRPDLELSLVRSYQPQDFDELIRFDGDLAALARRLKPQAPAFVLPGNESAVALTDALSDALGTPGNAIDLSAARRNKYLMIDRLAACGLKTAKQLSTSDLEEAVAWAEKVGWPVVAKPLASASTDRVHFCDGPDALKAGLADILSAKDFCGTPNEKALIQTYIDGDEYVVNAISWGGQHYISEVLRSAKRTLNGTPFVYDYYRLVPPDEGPAPALMAYIRQVLDALKISHGAAHAEVRATADGPVLVEIAARAMGPCGSTTAIAAGTGHDQAELLVDAFDGGATVRPLLGEHYRFKADAMVLYMPILVSGRMVAAPDLHILDDYASVRGYAVVPQVGDVIAPTLDLTQVLAKIYLANSDRAVFERDWRDIRSREGQIQPRVA